MLEEEVRKEIVRIIERLEGYDWEILHDAYRSLCYVAMPHFYAMIVVAVDFKTIDPLKRHFPKVLLAEIIHEVKSAKLRGKEVSKKKIDEWVKDFMKVYLIHEYEEAFREMVYLIDLVIRGALEFVKEK